MSKNDREHFEEYLDQTRVKHRILAEYIPAYFNVLKRWNQNLVYIDGFAGKGHYRDGGQVIAGSPIRVLEAVANSPELAKRVTTVFVEPDPLMYKDLSAAVEEFYKSNPSIREPVLQNEEFTGCIRSILEYIEESGSGLAPTFLFVDPCGVTGVSFKMISEIVRRDGCEALIFFNYSGVARIIGLAADEYLSPVLVDFFGDAEAAKDVAARVLSASESLEREKIVIAAYRDRLMSVTGAQFVIPFRFEHRSRRTTSHYLLHVSKHARGFEIMKHVMWESGRLEDGEEGRLELLQSSAGDLSGLMRPDLNQLDQSILRHLDHGPCKVEVFRTDWVQRPTDFYSEGVYRRRLIDLERRGLIRVLDEDGVTAVPAESRPTRKQQPTLAERLIVEKVI